MTIITNDFMNNFLFSTVIIDDEVSAILDLIDLLNAFPSINIIGTATNLDEGVELIKVTHPKIVFVDIDMPNRSGIEIFDEFDFIDFKIIFCSSKKYFTNNNIRNSTCEYLSKPLDIIKLHEHLEKVFYELLVE
ncbi:MAG TPA: response regulator [Paludibacter sp.]